MLNFIIDPHFWANSISAILVTVVIKFFIYDPFQRLKTTFNLCEIQDQLKKWRASGISEKHPTIQKLIQKEKEALIKFKETHN